MANDHRPPLSPVLPADPEVNEAVWQAWLDKGKRSDRVTARRARNSVLIVIMALSAGLAYHFF